MALLIILVLIGLPLAEIAVFIEVGSAIGLGSTLILTVMTAFAGVFLMRAQGLSTVFRVRDALNRGEVPVHAVFDGACLLIAGAFLLIPGFLTDSVGLLLFVPLVRRFLLFRLTRAADITVVMSTNGDMGGRSRRPYDVDGDYTDVTPTEETVLSPPRSSDKD